MTLTEAYLQPLAACFTPDVARRIIDFRPDVSAESRLTELRVKANEGTLTNNELAEYEEFVDTLDFVAALKVQARRTLDSKVD
ncbi:MAG: hypothetical protein K8U03_06315 [Planctomycetia bacterium]|nr:hypothetical protein [Planctomycetia bacterium]